jgi:hypothetical protein
VPEVSTPSVNEQGENSVTDNNNNNAIAGSSTSIGTEGNPMQMMQDMAQQYGVNPMMAMNPMMQLQAMQMQLANVSSWLSVFD